MASTFLQFTIAVGQSVTHPTCASITEPRDYADFLNRVCGGFFTHFQIFLNCSKVLEGKCSSSIIVTIQIIYLFP